MFGLIFAIIGVLGLLMGVLLFFDNMAFGIIIILLSVGLFGIIKINSNQEEIIEKLTDIKEDVNNPHEKVICAKCGKEYRDYAAYCPHCGAKPAENQ